MSPYGDRHPSTEPPTTHPLKIRLLLKVPGKGVPSMFCNRVPMDRDTPSPELLIYIFMYVCQSLQKGALVQNGEKHKVTVHGTPCRWKTYIQWGAAWFPKGIINDTAVSTPVPCSPQQDAIHLGWGTSEPR